MTVELMPPASPPVETIVPREEDALAIERSAGYVVIEITPHTGEPLDAAIARAKRYAAEMPGRTFGVFKLARDYHAQPGTADAAEQRLGS